MGGNLRQVFIPLGEGDPQGFLTELVQQVRSQPRIHLHLEHELAETTGFAGDFTSRLRGRDGSLREIRHGVTIVATGGEEYRGSEYLLGSDAGVLTGMEFELLLAHAENVPPPVTAG